MKEVDLGVNAWQGEATSDVMAGKYYQFYLSAGAVSGPSLIHLDTAGAKSLKVHVGVEIGPTFVRRFGVFGEATNSERTEFKSPAGIAIDLIRKRLYVAESTNHRVQVVSFEGKYIAHFGSYGKRDGEFDRPMGIAVEPVSGDIYVADFENNRIQVFDNQYAFKRVIGDGFGSGSGQLNHPAEVAVAPDKTIFVVEKDNHRIQQFDAAGQVRATFGGHGAADGKFVQPMGIALSADGQIAVADTGNHRIQTLRKNGGRIEVTHCVGTLGAKPGEFDYPIGVEYDEHGNLFVADLGNHRIQVFDSTCDRVLSWGASGMGRGLLNYSMRIKKAGALMFISECDVNRISVFDASPLEPRLKVADASSHSIPLALVGEE